ncbi:TetR/AcrR family transcriptional regulator [Actibacterium sp. 188UL27-1]|uniref:TetR/AcrR family transcriptional regulator n=1 Tax=Actibacterium sp. 188UL27-1 TaxID=2786961 RepID=UPI00195CBAAB|nr:TetR/AcrR family transcriptional regulator [Actibacterium sp. 188UL27-1]MBM7069827.1 TetR family transcriptional regulator [Actibacterium sp. 188UL27-1]
MGRPKSYDRAAAVEAACRAFWAAGYDALGVRALEERTGLNQFAIRTEFGGKEGLLLEAMAFYGDAAKAEAMAPMRSGGIEAIAGFLDGLVQEGSMTSSPHGCLIVNTGIENARTQSDAVTQAVRAYWAELEAHFRMALETAERAGALCADLDLAQVARGLVTSVMGVHAANRAAGSQFAGADLVAILREYLDALEKRDGG